MLSLRTVPLLSLQTPPMFLSLRTASILLSLRTSDRCHWCGNPRPSSFRTGMVLSFRASPQTGVRIRSLNSSPFIEPPPISRRGSFTCCLRRGTFVTSDKSTQKRRLKLRFKTSSARCALCQTCLMFLAQSPFPCAVVGQKGCATTAYRYRFAAAAPCHGSSFPLYRRTGALPIPTQPPSLELSFRASPQTGAGIRFP